MVVLLPKKADGLTALETSLTADKLDGWLAKLGHQRVAISLPRFKLACKFELSETLKALGMKDAFDEKADFSGISGGRRFSISAVIHQAFVDVNEEGTEAAAATAVVGLRAMAIVKEEPPIEFRADHPFLFLIRDVRSGSILFSGGHEPEGLRAQTLTSTGAPPPSALRRAASMKATISRVSRRSIGNCRVSNMPTIFLSNSR